MTNTANSNFASKGRENGEEEKKAASSIEVATGPVPRLPTSRRPPPPWSRRAREGAIALASNVPSKVEPSTLHAGAAIASSEVQRSVYLGYNCFKNARAHWFLYIPSTPVFSNMGKVIQVTGNPFTGFGFQIKLNHNATQQPDTHHILLGTVSPNTVIDDYRPDPFSGPVLRDQPLPGDRLEEIAYDLGLPYRDPAAVLPLPGDPVWLKPHPQFERCQEWIKEAHQALC